MRLSILQIAVQLLIRVPASCLHYIAAITLVTWCRWRSFLSSHSDTHSSDPMGALRYSMLRFS